MKLLTTAALALTSLVFTAHARIGETEGQSQQRYGAPKDDLVGGDEKPLLAGAIEKAYLYQNFRVRAAFAGGACQVIEYVRLKEGDVPAPQALTEAEIKAILEAEKGRWKWKEEKLNAPPGIADIAKGIKGALKLNKWERTDGAIAEYALGIVLKISTKNADDWAKRFARDAKKLPVKPGAKPATPAPTVPKF
jgi:hypothetical protein